MSTKQTIVVPFTKVKLFYGWLGNMSPHPVEFLGQTYPTTEALFQALRFDPDSGCREKIRAERNPMRAKFLAKNLINERPSAVAVIPQSEVDLGNMEFVLREKIRQHPDLRAQFLLIPKSALIVEDVSSRWRRGSAMFWGARCIDPQRRQDPSSWEGENNLGKTWMKLRSEMGGAR